MMSMVFAIGASASLMMAPAMAQSGEATAVPATNPLVDALAACLGQHEDARRLACFDAAATRLVAAEQQHDVVVVSRDDVRRTRRSLFGLTLGTKDVFAGHDKPADRIDRLDTVLLGAREIGNGRWSMSLAEGGRWQTVEAWTLTSDLKPGTTVLIHPASLGSYVARVGNQRAVRVRRVN